MANCDGDSCVSTSSAAENPHVNYGAVVEGPTLTDSYSDNRTGTSMAGVHLDTNAGLAGTAYIFCVVSVQMPCTSVLLLLLLLLDLVCNNFEWLLQRCASMVTMCEACVMTSLCICAGLLAALKEVNLNWAECTAGVNFVKMRVVGRPI